MFEKTVNLKLMAQALIMINIYYNMYLYISLYPLFLLSKIN